MKHLKVRPLFLFLLLYSAIFWAGTEQYRVRLERRELIEELNQLKSEEDWIYVLEAYKDACKRNHKGGVR